MGRHKHNLDGKGRVSIPVEFREILAGLDVRQLVITNGENCLDVYTPDQWERIMAWVDTLPTFLEETERFKQFYISAAQWVDLDRTGRVLIPPTLREEAGLHKEVMIMGDGEKIQFWDKATWDQVNETNRLQFRDIKNKLADYTER